MTPPSLAALATDPVVSEDPAVSESSAPFDAVAAPLRAALEQRGFTDLTVVQRAVLAPEARGRDLQVSSQTGSGKTVALGLVLAPGLLDAAGERGLRALVIAPTRELAVQVRGELEWLYASVPGLTVECVTGGSSLLQERRRLAKRPTIVVGTPGRLLDHIRAGAIDCSTVAELVLDEADRMLDMGFREELEAILDATPATRSTHLVSATFPAEIQRLARKYQRDPLAVEGTRLGAANEDIEHVGHLVRLHDRYAAIVNLLLLADGQRTLIFVNTRADAADLAGRLVSDGFAAAPISGELEQNQRTRTLEAFRDGVTTVLVATDVAARGLDIPDVALVVHTDAPFDAESYTHRAGRTGRAGNKGRSVLLSTPMRQKKVDFLLSRAKVKLAWRDVPTAATVEKALAKRERRRIREELEAASEPSATQIAFAEKLLDGIEPAALVARLVEMCRDPRLAEPCEIEPLSAATARPRTGERTPWQNRPDPRGRSSRAEEDRPRDDSRGRAFPSGDAPRREARGNSARMLADRFEMNWGQRGGATPQRVLAVLCRRGDVSSRAIGAIDIGRDVTTFEVAREISRDFERLAGAPDERDPRLLIRRARGDDERPRTRRDG